MPNPAYCTDNAAMIAYAAAKRLQHNLSFDELWDAKPRWSLAELQAV